MLREFFRLPCNLCASPPTRLMRALSVVPQGGWGMMLKSTPGRGSRQFTGAQALVSDDAECIDRVLRGDIDRFSG